MSPAVHVQRNVLAKAPRRPHERLAAEVGEVQVVDPNCDPPVIDPSCPATLQDAQGAACATLDNECIYGDFACLCTNCPPSAPVCGGAPVWRCEQPNPDPDCPDDGPLYGTSCPTEGKHCEYVCGPGGAADCVNGIWQEGNGPTCPVSSRRFKKNVSYLDDEALRSVAAQALSVRLAEYDFLTAAPAAQPQLGFIIEDHPGLPAVAQNGRMIDLYAYASMLLATVQV